MQESQEMDSIPRLGRSPGEKSDNPLQYSCLEKSMDRGDLWTTVQGITVSQIWLSDWVPPRDTWWTFFSKADLPSVYHLWWGVLFFGHLKIMLFILLLMSFKSSLYIFDNNPLSRCVFYNIFSQFVVCLISWQWFNRNLKREIGQKFEILVMFILSIISFMDHAFVGIFKQLSSPIPVLSRLSSVLSSRNFIFLCLALWSILS